MGGKRKLSGIRRGKKKGHFTQNVDKRNQYDEGQ
jgi:hypothetical protein